MLLPRQSQKGTVLLRNSGNQESCTIREKRGREKKKREEVKVKEREKQVLLSGASGEKT